MPPHIELLDDANDPLEPITFTLQGGETSDPIEIRIANDLAGALVGVTEARGFRFAIRAVEAGVPVRSGVPLLDELWSRGQITGTTINPDNAAMADQYTSAMPLGTGSEIPLEPIPPGTARTLIYRLTAPGSASTQTYVLDFVVYGNEASWPVASTVTQATGSGIIPAERRGLLKLLRGSEIIADGTDTVIVDRGQMASASRTITFVRSTHAFTLADSNAVNLAAGESYIVTVSRNPTNGAAVFTKGPKAEGVNRSATPPGNLYAGRLVVRSDDGVAVTVDQADVSQAGVEYEDFHARPGVGLSVIIGTGQGLTGSDIRQHVSGEVTIGDLDANATTYVWRIGAGTYATSDDDAAAPELGADLMWEVVTDAVGVSEIIDRRRMLHRAIVTDHISATWRGVLTDLAEPALGLAWALNHLDDAEIEAFEVNLTNPDATWTGGEIKADARVFAPGAAIPFPAGGAGAGGASIFVSAGTDDQRPVIAFDVDALRAVAIYHETRSLPKGSRVVFDLVTTMAGPGAEPEVEVLFTLHIRRRAA